MDAHTSGLTNLMNERTDGNTDNSAVHAHAVHQLFAIDFTAQQVQEKPVDIKTVQLYINSER
jgi:hypothetical protein